MRTEEEIMENFRVNLELALSGKHLNTTDFTNSEVACILQQDLTRNEVWLAGELANHDYRWCELFTFSKHFSYILNFKPHWSWMVKEKSIKIQQTSNQQSDQTT